jgi:lysozyme
MIEENKINKIAEMIKAHEGLRLKPYTCSAGALTIGYGRNLEANGITQEEADLMFSQDYTIAKWDAIQFVGMKTWDKLNEPRKAVLIDMAFNLGAARLSAFVDTKKAIQGEAYKTAAKNMRASLWYTQVKNRAVKLSNMMESGEWS